MNRSRLLNKKVKKFESMAKSVNILLDLGFQYNKFKHIPCHGPAGESFEFEFISKHGISVEFTFYPAFNNKPDYVVLYIINEKINRDFSLESWVQKYKSKPTISPFNLSSYHGDYEQQLNEFLNFLNKLFTDRNLKLVIEGKEWNDVKFNWGDLK